MYEWQLVVLFGLLGGFCSTFLPAGTDVPSPKVIERMIDGHDRAELIYHLIRNTLFGGIGSGAFWLGYTSTADFQSTTIHSQQILASFATGGAGIYVVNNLFRGAQKSEALKDASDVILRLEEAIERLGRSSGGGEGEGQ